MIRIATFLLVLVVLFGCGAGETPTEADRQEGVVAVEGGELRWIAEGSGPVLLVVGSVDLYPGMFSRELRDHFRLVFLDGRHFAKGYAPEGDALDALSMDTWVEDIEVARNALNLGRISVLGHSIHGQIALGYAHRYPQAVEALVLIGPVAFFGPEYEAAFDAFWERVASDERKAAHEAGQIALDSVLPSVPGPRRFAVRYAYEAPVYWADPEYDPSPLLEDLETTPAWPRLTRTVPDRATVESRLRGLEVPTLLILGRLDFSIPHTIWEEMIQGVPVVEYVLLEEASHNPQTENPEVFDSILVRFAGAR
jgi:proline iminopeptidase